MLTKRTNILLTQEDYNLLTRMSRERGKSRGELIRYALREVYATDRELNERKKLMAEIKKLTRGVKKIKRNDYRALINEGRRY